MTLIRSATFLVLLGCLALAACDSTEPGNLPGTFSATVETTTGSSTFQGAAFASGNIAPPSAELPSNLFVFSIGMAEGSFVQNPPSGRSVVIGFPTEGPPEPGTYSVALNTNQQALAVYTNTGDETTDFYASVSGTVTIESVGPRTVRGRFEIEATPGLSAGDQQRRVTLHGSFNAGRVDPS